MYIEALRALILSYAVFHGATSMQRTSGAYALKMLPAFDIRVLVMDHDAEKLAILLEMAIAP